MPRCLPGGHAARPWRGARECPAPAPLRTLQTNQLTPRRTNTEGTPPNLPSRDRSHGARGGSQACDRPASFRHRELSQCDRGIFQGCRGWLPAKLAPLLATTAACEMFIVGVQGLAPATTAGDYGWRASQGDKALRTETLVRHLGQIRALLARPALAEGATVASRRSPLLNRLLNRLSSHWDSARGPRGIRPEGPVGFAYKSPVDTLGFDPSTHRDSTRGPRGIRSEGPVGLDPRTHRDSTPGPRGIRPDWRLGLEPRTQWDSTRRPSGTRPGLSGIRPEGRVGVDPRTHWESTRGPSGIRPEGPVGFDP